MKEFFDYLFAALDRGFITQEQAGLAARKQLGIAEPEVVVPAAPIEQPVVSTDEATPEATPAETPPEGASDEAPTEEQPQG